MSTPVALLITVIAQAATVLALAGRHLTIWIACWPVASVPAQAVFAAGMSLVVAACIALLVVRCLGLYRGGCLVWGMS